MKIVGATGFTNNFYDLLMFMGGLWVLKWAWQTFFWVNG